MQFIVHSFFPPQIEWFFALTIGSSCLHELNDLNDLRLILLQGHAGEAKCKIEKENLHLPGEVCTALTVDYFINI